MVLEHALAERNIFSMVKILVTEEVLTIIHHKEPSALPVREPPYQCHSLAVTSLKG